MSTILFSESLKWGLSLTNLKDPYIGDSLKLNLSYIQKNFIRIFRNIGKLPLILQLSIHWNIPHLLSCLLAVMNSGFSSKNCMYPLDHFMKLTLISLEEIVRKIFQDHNIGITVGSDGKDYVQFSKANFKFQNVKICHYKIHSIDEALSAKNMSDLFYTS